MSYAGEVCHHLCGVSNPEQLPPGAYGGRHLLPPSPAGGCFGFGTAAHLKYVSCVMSHRCCGPLLRVLTCPYLVDMLLFPMSHRKISVRRRSMGMPFVFYVSRPIFFENQRGSAEKTNNPPKNKHGTSQRKCMSVHRPRASQTIIRPLSESIYRNAQKCACGHGCHGCFNDRPGNHMACGRKIGSRRTLCRRTLRLENAPNLKHARLEFSG